MPHQLTPTEANALHYHALALRPDWHTNQPGPTWAATTGGNNKTITLYQADNYHHAHAALTAYATQTEPRMRTPNLYPNEGPHWDTTRTHPGVAQPVTPCPDHPYDPRGNTDCGGCWADIKAGDRPAEKLGQHFDVSSCAAPGTAPGTGRTGAESDAEGGWA